MSAPARIPVIIALGDFASGVVSWAFRLRDAFANHPRYEILLMNCYVTGNRIGRFDLEATSDSALRTVLAERAPAIVVPNFVWDAFPVCVEVVAAGAQLRTIGFCRADSEDEYYAPLDWFEPAIARFVAVSPECGKRLSERLPARSKDITVLPTGVWVPERLDREWQGSPIRLVYGGRIVQVQKRVMDFIPLVERLLDAGIDFRFNIAGVGRQLLELKAAMAQVPHDGRVQFLERVAPGEMPGVWRGHDVFIQTSDYEGTSNSMLESMAQGTVPVITRTDSGVAGVIEEDVNGILVPVGDMAAMAHAIGELAQRPERLEALGRAAHQTATRYSMENYVRRFTEALDAAQAAPVPAWPPGRPLHPSRAFDGIALDRSPVTSSIESQAPASATNDSLTSPAAGKRLLIAFPSPVRGGAEEYTLTIARGARARGWDVIAGFPYRHTTDSLVKDFRALGAHYHPLEICDLGNKREQAIRRKRLTRSVRFLLRFKPDMVLLELPGARFGLEFMIACALLGKPLVTVYQLVREGNRFRRMRCLLQSLLRLRGQRYVAVSGHNRSLLARMLRMRARGIEVIPNGASPVRFACTAGERQVIRDRIRQELQLPPDALLLLTVGRFAEQKGHDLLVPAIPHIVESHPAAHFLWAGTGPHEKHLRAQITAYRCESRVHLLGHRSDIRDLLLAADLFVHPTRLEGQPFSLLEAMAAGLPIVSTRASGIAEVIDHEREGLLCEVEDVRALREAVLWALAHPDCMKEMAERAGARVEAFSEEEMVRRTLDLLAGNGSK